MNYYWIVAAVIVFLTMYNSMAGACSPGCGCDKCAAARVGGGGCGCDKCGCGCGRPKGMCACGGGKCYY